MYWTSDIVEAGGLTTYSVSQNELARRAEYVDKILKGGKRPSGGTAEEV